MINITRVDNNFFKINTNNILKKFYNNYKNTFLFFNKHGNHIIKNKNNVLQAFKYVSKKKDINDNINKFNKNIKNLEELNIEIELELKKEKKLLFQNKQYKKLLIELNQNKLNIVDLKKEIKSFDIPLEKLNKQIENIELHTPLEELNRIYNINNNFALLFELLADRKKYLKTFSSLFISLCLNAYKDEQFIEDFNDNEFFKNYNKNLTVQDFLLSSEIDFSLCFE
jgi:hypothetical protein